MTLVSVVGFIGGSRRSPTCGITVFDDAGASISYDSALDVAIANAPSTILGATINPSDVTLIDRSHSTMQFEIGYRGTLKPFALRSRNPRTKARTIQHLTPSGAWDSTGDVTSDWSSQIYALDQHGSMAEYNNGRPVIVEPLDPSMSVSYYTTEAFITEAYLDKMHDFVERGVFNDDTFWGKAAGELQFIGFTANEKEYSEWDLTYEFGYRKTRTNLTVADITIPTLEGRDEYWVVTKEQLVDDKIQTVMGVAIVGTIWAEEDFAELNLPWYSYLSTRTDDDEGIITTLYPHDITGTDDVAIYWEGGNMTGNVTAVGANTITFDTGVGNALPFVNTGVYAVKV